MKSFIISDSVNCFILVILESPKLKVIISSGKFHLIESANDCFLSTYHLVIIAFPFQSYLLIVLFFLRFKTVLNVIMFNFDWEIT